MKRFYKQPTLTVMYSPVDVLTLSGEDSRFNLNWVTFEGLEEDEGGIQP
jgi:hypothetical protein